jgi:hypothetical protein
MVGLDRGCFACRLGPDEGTLFMTTNGWRGTGAMAAGVRKVQVLAIEAAAPGVGWPGG